VVDANIERVRGYLDSLAKKGKWAGDVDVTMAKLRPLGGEADLAGCGAPILLEVIFEDLALKCESTRSWARSCPRHRVLDQHLVPRRRPHGRGQRAPRPAGRHPRHEPVHLMKGVEIVRHDKLAARRARAHAQDDAADSARTRSSPTTCPASSSTTA